MTDTNVDVLLGLTLAGYVVAMLLYAAEFAVGVQRPAAQAARAAPRQAARESRRPAVRAGAGAATDLAARPEEEEPADVPAGRHAGRLARAALAALVVAVAAHLATVAARGVAAERLPWGNMFEYALTVTLVGAVAWLVVLARQPQLRHLGLYLALVNAALLFIARTGTYTPVEPLVPALDSYWFTIHVSAAALAAGLFLVGFVTAVMYLVRAGYERGAQRFPYPLGQRLPAAATVERVTFWLHASAFPIWTFAVIAGSIWAEAAWGRYWGWDPKEVWAFISWVVYAGYLHARATPSVRRTVVAWLAIAGWLTMLMNLFGVNLFFEGLHSYA